MSEPLSPSAVMVEALEREFAKGWHILAILETAYAGPVQTPFHSDAGASEPDKVQQAQFFLPHCDHYHVYTFTLIRDELNPKLDTLSTNALAALKIMAMDEQATVQGESGNC